MAEYKEQKALIIVETLKKELLEVVWSDCKYGYNSARNILPWLQEEAEYAIKGLSFTIEKETLYLTKIERVMSEYVEEY